MNSVLHPLRNMFFLGLGLAAAVAGIWIFSAGDLAIVQGAGFLLLAPAGTLMAVGLCRLWDEGVRSGKMDLPAIPARLRREVSFGKGVRCAVAALCRPVPGTGGKRRSTHPRRPVSWAE